MGWIAAFAFALAFLCMFLLARNEAVYAARRSFIYSDDFPSRYELLPDYYSMVANPKYWLLWSADHWRAWVSRREAVSA